MNKQIEDIGKTMCRNYGSKVCGSCDAHNYCLIHLYAVDIYNAGYRKQGEGEWLQSDIPQEKYVCSVCGGACWYYDYQGEVAKSRFCPNCGAKMKGDKTDA